MITRDIIDHLRAQIVAETGLDESQVHLVSDIDTPVESLPEIVLYSMEDRAKADEDVDSSGGQERTFVFGITVSVASDVESATDDLSRLVRKAVLQDPYLNNLVLSTYWDSTEWGSGSSAVPVRMAKHQFHANYHWSPEW